MGIDVADLLGQDLGVSERVAHHAHGAVRVLRRRGDVEGVARHAITYQLGEHRSAALAGEAELFQKQDSRPFADNEAVAAAVEGSAGAFGLLVASGKRAHRRKPAHTHRRDRSLRAAADHHVGVAARDDFVGVAHGVRARRAGRAGGRIRTLGAPADGDKARREVRDRGGNEEGAGRPREAAP